jgi:hypothetical protein
MVWKKVSNSDAGDSTHFGGDDVDKISLTFNAETQSDPINIKDENLVIVDPADTSKKVRFDAVNITTSTTRVLTLPDADVTLASTAVATASVAGLMSSSDKQKITAMEASADVTDATNVNAAGALMLTDTTTAGLGIVVDEDAMGSNSDTKVPTQQSVVAYVASQITAEDLDTAGDSGTGAIDLNSQSLTVSGGTGITTTASNQGISIVADDATASAKGVVELATTAELNTGTDTTRAVTVAGIEASARSVKLDAIEASATADQSNAEIRTAVGAATDSNVFTDANVTTLGNRAPLASPALTGTATAVNLTMSGDLTVNGTTTTLDTTNLAITDKNIMIADGSANNAASNGAGITIEGGSDADKTITWATATGDFDISENIDIASGKVFKVDGATTLTATGLGSAVLASSLTSVGTLASPVLTTPNIGTPSAGVLTNCTALPAAQVAQGTMASGMVLVAPVLGTPASGALTNCTAIPMAQASGIIPDANMPNLTGAITTVEGAVATTLVANAVDSDNYVDGSIDLAHVSAGAKTECISMAVSDNTTALTVATVFTFYMPYAMTLTDIKASVLTAPTGAGLIVDVHDSGTTIMGTDKLDIDASEFHTSTAGTQPALTDTALANNAKIEVIVDQIGSTVAGAGLVIYLIGYQT